MWDIVMLIAGGARAPHLPTCLCSLHAGTAQCVEPVEEAVRLGSLSGLLASTMRLCQDGAVILCGHSFGATVAYFIAVRLTFCGAEPHGIVSMDCRSGITMNLAECLPQGLWQPLARQHVRLRLPE